jgi:Fur family transcriptional regulator, peroxide stress response regulator
MIATQDPKIHKRVEALGERLRERGCRLTPQRLALLRLLVSSNTHPTAEQLYQQLHEDFPTTSLATVYKTLAVLKETGDVLEVGFGNHPSRFDGNNLSPHAHLICRDCGEIIDIMENRNLSEFSRQVTSRSGYRLISQRIDIFGICPHCKNGDKKPSNTIINQGE